MFKITDHVEFDSSNRGICPCCENQGKGKKKNLSLVPNSDGAYKCHRGCTPQDIRAALGQEKPKQIPTALARQQRTTSSVSPQRIKEDHTLLIKKSTQAVEWLNQRGISEEIIKHYKLGIARSKVGDRHLPSISIPIPNADGTSYWRKKRIAPWLSSDSLPEDTPPWSQWGIPQQVFFTHKPEGAVQTYLCEGEWDAIRLGWEMRRSEFTAVACFTCGGSASPGVEELDRLPGDVIIFYDLDEPGRKGAEKLAGKLGSRAKIATVPAPADAPDGWDISDALAANLLGELGDAASNAAVYKPEAIYKNKLRDRMVTNDELMARAPDYIDWLVPDLLTSNELFILGMPPRGGKSLFCMTLAKAIASGGKFLDRPVTQGGVIYINLEDGEAKIKTRQIAQGWASGMPVYWFDQFRLSELPDLNSIIDELGDIRVVFIDTFSRARNDGQKETGAEMGQVLEPLQEMCKAKNVCCILTHHFSKGTIEKDQDPFDLLRGSGSIRATARGAMVVIPGENGYRLIAENGHTDNLDLKIRLQPETLEWRLLGNWQPRVDGDMKAQVLDHLNLMGQATVTQVAHALNFKASSVSTILYRLQADDMVVKTGGKGRTPATYMRSANLSQQLNALLAHQDEGSESDTALRQQKRSYEHISDQGDHFDKSDHSKMITLEENDHLEPGRGNCWRKGSNPGAVSDVVRQQGVELLAQTENVNCHTLKAGDRVYYSGSNNLKSRLCGRKKLTVQSVENSIAVVNHEKWLVTQSIEVCDLEPAK